MGHGTYSYSSSVLRNSAFVATNAVNSTIFTEQSINNAMNPYGIRVRESRDSAEHPNSLAIIMALDVTGSMGSIPNFLVKDGFANLMNNILEGGEKDPQVLFLAIGDHEHDRSPLQVAQFESSDELLDKWLKTVYLEGNGGSNSGESYLLAWYFAAYHTSTDCFEKRGRKGILVTIGDEPVLKNVPSSSLKKLMGDGQYENFSAAQLLDKAREKYDVYHVHVKETGAGSRQEYIDSWKPLMGQNLIIVERSTDIAKAVSDTVLKHKKGEAAVSNEEVL